MKLSEIQNKDIVNINDGKNIGSIIDAKIEKETGKITSLILEPNKNIFNLFNKEKEIEIKWDNIKMIGEDVILVNISY